MKSKNSFNHLDFEKMHTFSAINFGCRVNSAETNQISQILLNNGLTPIPKGGDIILINTCSITKKGEIESLSKIRTQSRQYPNSKIIITGCADLNKVVKLDNIIAITNTQKESLTKSSKGTYTPKIKDKFSNTHRYLLKIQSGCSANCTYCTVPTKRNYQFSLSIDDAIDTVNKAVLQGYKEVIITGVNLVQYKPGFSLLVSELLLHTTISLISFGSIPLLCIDKLFLDLYRNSLYNHRLSDMLHIPLQSSSDTILEAMKRPYNRQKIHIVFDKLKEISVIKPLKFGTDIIVGFPGEIESDHKKTIASLKRIGFSKIHVFKFSPRRQTQAWDLYHQVHNLSPEILKNRSREVKYQQI